MDTRGRVIAGSHNRNELHIINADEIGRVVHELRVTKKKRHSMIWTMNSNMVIQETLATSLSRCWHLAYAHVILGLLLPLKWIQHPLFARSLSLPMAKRMRGSPDKHALIIPPFLGRGRRIHPVVETEPSMSLPPRAMDPKKDLAVYGYGTVAWKDRMKEWRRRQNDKLQMVKHEGNGGDDEDDPNLPTMDKGRQRLWRKIPVSSSKINPYRMVILMRLAVLGLFFDYRIHHPVKDAYALWLISIICEIWFAVSWIFDQFPKWWPIERETYLNRLSQV